MTPERLRDWLITEVAEACHLDPSEVDVNRPLREYGLSSREALRLAGELEDVLDEDLSSTLLWDHPTITALVAALTENEEPQRIEAPVVASGDPIAVIGIGCRLPGGVHGPGEFWDLLDAGRDAVTEVPEGRWEQFGQRSPAQVERLTKTTRYGGFLDGIAEFDAEFFGIAPREAASMDPQQRLLLEVAFEALQHAGIAPDSLRRTMTGVFVGISGNEYSHLTMGDVSRIDAWSGTGAALSVAANRLSYVLDLRGPSVAVDSACSSSLVAVHMAMQSLRTGESEVALAAGVNLLLGPGVTVAFDQMGVTARDGRCKAFDARANGIARSEGAGVVVLKPLSAAKRDGDRVLAVLRGSAVNSDGRSNGLTAPLPEAQQELLRLAYARAGVDPSEVDYVEAHGTGTLLGDPIEAKSLGAVLGEGREHPLLLGSVKTNLGHLEAAAGITGLIKVVLSLVHGRIPASLHYTEPNPHIPFDELRLAVAADRQPWPDRGRPALAGVSGFGFGGTNAHVVVEQAPPPERTEPDGRPHQFVLTAPTSSRLRGAAEALASWVDRTRPALSDVEFTLARRAGSGCRAVITARDGDQLVSRLREFAADPESTGVSPKPGPGPVWVFSGQGKQWAGMGQRLLAAEPAFAEAVDEVDRALAEAPGPSLRETLSSGTEPVVFEEMQRVQFGLQVAFAALWRHYGVEPAAVIGHSVGEVAAAVIAGALSLEDGAKVLLRRSRHLATTAGLGAMAVLELSPDEVGELLPRHPRVDLAAVNAPGQTVVAGPRDDVAELAGVVERGDRMARLVKVTVAGHSRVVEDAAAALGADLPGLTPARPKIPIYRTALEDPRSEVGHDAAYWAANVRRTVRFADAVTAALEDGFTTFVEISPHPVLCHAIEEIATAHGIDATVLGTVRRAPDETEEFHANLGALIAAGHAFPSCSGQIVDVPATPWEHREYWTEPIRQAGPAGAHPLLGTHVELPGEDRHLWRADLGTALTPWLGEHRIGGRPILPAACFVEMAFAAAAEALGREPGELSLHALSLHRPLALGEHTDVTTTFDPSGRILFHTKDSDGSWLLHGEVTVRQADGSRIPWEPGERTPGEGMSGARLYELMRNLGVDYGPTFAGVARVRTDSGRAVAALELPEEAPKAGYAVPPVLLDCCLQAFAAALSTMDGNDEVLHLPMEFGAVRLLGDPARGKRVHVSVEPAASGLLGELRLTDVDDEVLLEITDVFARPVGRSEFAVPLRDSLLERVWVPADEPGTGQFGPVLLVAEEGDPLTGPATEALAARGVPATVVTEIDQAMLVEYRPSVVVLLLGAAGDDGLEAAQRALFDGVEWVRALVDQPGKPPRLWLVTRSAASVLDGEPGDPGPASVRGLVRVLSFEHPEIRASWLDVDSADALAAEVHGDSAEDEVAWRSGTRYTARLVPTEAPPRASGAPVRPDGGYVITGGLGGLGLVLAGWLAGQGAGTIVLNGRSAPKPAAQAVIEELRSTGTAIEVVLGDVAEPGVAERLLAAAGTVRGIVHAAAVFDDRTVARLDRETLRRTWLPKAYGAWRLHEASRDLDLDFWLGFSSATALHGLPGQPAYASANAYLDAVVAYRRAAGLPGTTINWGTWAEVGAAADLEVPWLHPLRPEEGLAVMTDVLANGVAGLGALRLDTARLVAGFPGLVELPFFGELLAGHAVAEPASWPGIDAVRERDPGEARQLVGEQLRFRIASVMGLRDEALGEALPLTSLGVDSLLAVRIRNSVAHDFGITLPVSLLLRGASLSELRRHVLDELDLAGEPRNGGKPVRGKEVLVPPRDAAERLVVAAWQEVLGVPVGVNQHFEALGGDAGKARQIASLLSTRSGTDLPLARLFAEPTPELMAAVVRDADRQTGPLRVLREGGNAAPVFFFHPGGGNTAVFRQLVDLLDPDVPAYGLDRVDNTRSVERRVERFLPELRRVQPSGPYRLAGWSFGGFLAFETAQQLTAAGERVELLAMIDPILPLPQERELSELELLRRRFERFGEFLETSYGKRIELPLGELARLGDEDQAELLVNSVLEAGVVDARVSDAIITHQRESFLDARLLERYRPAEYHGPVVFYSAAEKVPGGLRDPRFDRTDPARGWDAVCRDLELLTVSGHHLSMLDPPHVETIARHMDAALARVRG